MRTAIGFMLGIALCSASPAFSEVQSECAADVGKFCKDVKSGEGRTLKCLRAHEAELSQPCKAQLNTAAQYMACVDDGIRLCPGLQPNWGELMACLRTHINDLSSECKLEIRKSRP